MAQAIEGLAASNVRAFGTEVTSALIAGATSQLASELQYAKQEISDLRKENNNLKDGFSESKIECAVLKERIHTYRASRHLRNFGIAVGTVLIGVSFKLFQNAETSYGYISLAVGALLLVLGWFSVPRGSKK